MGCRRMSTIVTIGDEYKRYENFPKDFKLPLEQFTELHELYGKLDHGFTDIFRFELISRGLTTLEGIAKLIMICSDSELFGVTRPVEPSMASIIDYLKDIKVQYTPRLNGKVLDVDMIVSEVISRLFHT
jgi:hypothetical protein